MKTALLLALGLVTVAIILAANEPDDAYENEQVSARLDNDITHAAYAN